MQGCPGGRRRRRAFSPISMRCCALPAPTAPVSCAPTSTTPRSTRCRRISRCGGQPIKLETEFIITRRMAPSLDLAGAALDHIVHAQVYLADRDDYSAFNEAWSRHFAASGPTLSIIPCVERGLAPFGGKIEIN